MITRLLSAGSRITCREHVMRNLKAHRLVKKAQQRFVNEPVFDLEARAECALSDEHPDCTAPGLRIAYRLEARLKFRYRLQGEFFADAVPYVLRDSRPEPLSQHT